jgi:hypothetical protein
MIPALIIAPIWIGAMTIFWAMAQVSGINRDILEELEELEDGKI